MTSTKIHVASHRCRVAIAGTGYVGLSNTVLLAQHSQLVAIDAKQD